MVEGLPANTNPFVVLIGWDSPPDPKFHELAPEYFHYDETIGMPVAKEVAAPELTQKDAEKLVRNLVGKNRAKMLAIHKNFSNIIPKDLKKVLRVANTFSTSHSKNGFFVPCCTEMECEFLK